MPEENQSKPLPELLGTVPQNAEASFGIPQAAAEFRTMPNHAEAFGKVPQATDRKENHTLTVREVARMFETAGVARTERSIINWCQPNRQGITRLDSYYDPNERKYYITPQSIEAVIQEEMQRLKKSVKMPDAEPFRNSVAHMKHQTNIAQPTYALKLKELEREIIDLRIANRGKDHFIELLKQERAGFIEHLQTTSRTVGQLETKLHQLESPNSAARN